MEDDGKLLKYLSDGIKYLKSKDGEFLHKYVFYSATGKLTKNKR